MNWRTPGDKPGIYSHTGNDLSSHSKSWSDLTSTADLWPRLSPACLVYRQVFVWTIRCSNLLLWPSLVEPVVSISQPCVMFLSPPREIDTRDSLELAEECFRVCLWVCPQTEFMTHTHTTFKLFNPFHKLCVYHSETSTSGKSELTDRCGFSLGRGPGSAQDSQPLFQWSRLIRKTLNVDTDEKISHSDDQTTTRFHVVFEQHGVTTATPWNSPINPKFVFLLPPWGCFFLKKGTK